MRHQIEEMNEAAPPSEPRPRGPVDTSMTEQQFNEMEERLMEQDMELHDRHKYSEYLGQPEAEFKNKRNIG
jgi:hypothetical protein